MPPPGTPYSPQRPACAHQAFFLTWLFVLLVFQIVLELWGRGYSDKVGLLTTIRRSLLHGTSLLRRTASADASGGADGSETPALEMRSPGLEMRVAPAGPRLPLQTAAGPLDSSSHEHADAGEGSAGADVSMPMAPQLSRKVSDAI